MSRTTKGRGRLFASVLDTIGDTPAIRINSLAPAEVDIYVKAEAFNPAGSVKDRLALSIIEEAEQDGRLSPGQTVVEATSGNTGIGLAMVCAAKGYPLVVTMADSFSVERRKLMRMMGAKVVLTPRAQKGLGMYRKAVELARGERVVLCPPIRDRGQCPHPREHDRLRDPRRFRRRAAGLLGHRLWHGRHGYGRGSRSAPRATGDQDRPVGACQCAASGQRARPGAKLRSLARRKPPCFRAASDPGLDA